jgi:hypothetical protein
VPFFGFAIDYRRIARDFQRRNGIAMLEAHPMLLALAPDGQLQIFAAR